MLNHNTRNKQPNKRLPAKPEAMHYSKWDNIGGRILTLWSAAGICVGPLLFIIYINKWLETEHLLLYADDTAFICFYMQLANHPKELEATLIETLLKLNEWCQINKITMNTKKSKTELFGTRPTKNLKLNCQLGEGQL